MYKYIMTTVQRKNLSKQNVDVTSMFAKVYKTLTRIDVDGIFQNPVTSTLQMESFKSWNVNVTSTLWKADPRYTFSQRLSVM